MGFLKLSGRAVFGAPRRSPDSAKVASSGEVHTAGSGYRRYHIETKKTPDLKSLPPRFRVLVRKPRLARLLLKEWIQFRGNRKVVFSRPCVYGVFSGPVGGFSPREHLCVGCLRCMIQYPEVVRIVRNPARQTLGDSFFNSAFVDAVLYEAQTGLVPVRGAGFRGPFGGPGWDGMWTDMSEIVRPTRDGIHGREFISTAVDIGARPDRLRFDSEGKLAGPLPRIVSLQVPFLLDVLPDSVAGSGILHEVYARVARDTESLFFVPLAHALKWKTARSAVATVLVPGEESLLKDLVSPPAVIEVTPVPATRVATDPAAESESALNAAVESLRALEVDYPDAVLILRVPYLPKPALMALYERGIRSFHLVADYHGRDRRGIFVMDLIRTAHQAFVESGVRDQVTLIGSGGMVAAEHIPKAIICGLDAVALDTAPLAALQADFIGECKNPATALFRLPDALNEEWAAQRLRNLFASWRDQLLEVLGAMGMREVRRLRGEIGRAMFQKDLEREAFSGIEGYNG